MKKLVCMLFALCLVCFAAVSVSAVNGDIPEGDMNTLNIEWSADLELTEAGQTVVYEMPAETYLMALDINKKLDGETLYVSAHNGVQIMVNSITQQPVDGWYCFDVATLHKHQIAIVNWNSENVDLTFKVPAPQPELFDIDVARMILGNALEFQFGVAKTKIPDTTGYYAIVEKTWADGTTTEKIVPAEQWGEAGIYYAIIYDGLAAKEMGDTFYVTIYNAKGQAVSNAKQDSVRDYVSRTYKTQSETGKTMMVDMLNYGAAAQVHFDYGTDNLANKDLTDEQKASATSVTPEMNNNVVNGTNYQASRFILSSRIQVQVGFKGLKEGMYAIYTYTNNNDEVKEIRVEYADFVANGSSKIGVELSALVYADARALVDIVVYNADGSVHATASDSIESACARSTKGDDVYEYLMKFADSARKHLYNK